MKGETTLRRGNREAVDLALRYLDADPYHIGSGYDKQHITRHLKYAPLTEEQSGRAREILLDIVDSHYRQEFRSFCRLAASVQNEPFLKRLEERTLLEDEGIAMRANWMLDYIREFNKHTRRNCPQP